MRLTPGDNSLITRWFKIELVKFGLDPSSHTDDDIFKAVEAIAKRSHDTLEEIKKRYPKDAELMQASYTLPEMAAFFRENHEWAEGLLPKMKR